MSESDRASTFFLLGMAAVRLATFLSAGFIVGALTWLGVLLGLSAIPASALAGTLVAAVAFGLGMLVDHYYRGPDDHRTPDVEGA